MYMCMMGYSYPMLERATSVAILNANYMAKRLSSTTASCSGAGLAAHEFILDCSKFVKKGEYNIGAENVAKRLMYYCFHTPTMSWLS